MAREGKPPAFQFYAADWLADLDVRAMSLAERGLYVDLLAFCWREGSVPDDMEKCGRLVGSTPREIRALWPAVRARFSDLDGRLLSERMEMQRLEMSGYRSGASAGGIESAARLTPEQRSERARNAANAMHAGKQAVSRGQAEREQKPANISANGVLTRANTASASASAEEKSNTAQASLRGVDLSFAAVYAAYPRKRGKTPGLKLCARLIKTPDQLDDLRRAVENYARRCRIEGIPPDKRMHFSTFMGQWTDFLEPEAPESGAQDHPVGDLGRQLAAKVLAREEDMFRRVAEREAAEALAAKEAE